MKKESVIDGYIIVWDLDSLVKGVSYKSFDRTAAAAWSRFVGPIEGIDLPTRIQRYHDHGYRVKRCKLTIELENDRDERISDILHRRK